MKEYMLIFRHEKDDDSVKPTEEQMMAMLQKYQDWISGLAKKGNFASTNRLLSEGKTIKPDNVITDGPYIEGKELLGGYVVVKADSLDKAVELAKGCPLLSYGGKVEVRSIMKIDSDPSSKTFLHPIN